MTNIGGVVPRAALTSLIAFGMMSVAASAEDLSRYRSFQLGTDLPAVAKQVGVSPSQVKTIHSRPALIQDLAWRPQPLGPSSRMESVQEVVFSFYDGKLFRIAVQYDRYETEGLTAADFTDALSTTYGIAEKPVPPANALQARYSDQDQIVARWRDSQFRFDLIRSSYGPTFRLIGVLKGLEAPALIAIAEAERLDVQEAPQRDAARMADEKAGEQVRLDRSRLVNKPNFRP